ncbi:hypothetical protein [Streptomyces luteogriseus]|uniref:Uncharacterized protein n=1 Tax=Streptomyces luteogriseus TaxID=68233 RepID=A0A7W7GGF6_9ACTN|nr:hypothetical protein [Streptomyces luteogriseus]MBB4712816.1 hypothetical protein [Streptomyces luteogriseus]
MSFKTGRGLTLATIATAAGVAATLGTAPAQASSMKPGTDTYVKVSTKAQSITSGVAGVDRSEDKGCFSDNTYNAIVTWKLGKVTKSSIRVNSIDIRHSNGRKIYVGNYALVDDNKRVWNKVAPGDVGKGAHHRKYTINKTLQVKKHKAYLVMKTTISSRKNEDALFCGQSAYIYFYLKQK